MANSDYTERAVGAFCTVAKLVSSVLPAYQQIIVADVKTVDGEPAGPGGVLLVNDEFMVINSISGNVWSVKRGCIDTVPKQHGAGATIFLLGTRVASDGVEYLPTETISLKLLARTTSSVVPIENTPPNQITFNNRFARPYPPGRVRVNNAPWHVGVTLDGATDLALTWYGRNKVVQADQVLGHEDAAVTAEVGTTYTVRLYTESDVLVKTIAGITVSPWSYSFAQMVGDFALSSFADTGIYTAYMTLRSVFDGIESADFYSIPLRLDTSDIGNTPTTTIQAAARAFWEFEESDTGSVFKDRVGNYPMTVRLGGSLIETKTATGFDTSGGPHKFIGRTFMPAFTDDFTTYIPTAANFKLLNADWTFGLWVSGRAASSGSSRFLMGNVGSDATQFQAYMSIDSATDSLNFNVSTDGTVTGRTVLATAWQLAASEMALITFTLDRAANQIKARMRKVSDPAMASAQTAFAGALFTGASTANFAINDALSSDTTFFSGSRECVNKADQAFVLNMAISDTDFGYLFNAGLGKTWAQIRHDAGLSPASGFAGRLLNVDVFVPTITRPTADGSPFFKIAMKPNGTFELSGSGGYVTNIGNWFDGAGLTSQQILLFTEMYNITSVPTVGTVGTVALDNDLPRGLENNTSVTVLQTSSSREIRVQISPKPYHPLAADTYHFGVVKITIGNFLQT